MGSRQGEDAGAGGVVFFGRLLLQMPVRNTQVRYRLVAGLSLVVLCRADCSEVLTARFLTLRLLLVHAALLQRSMLHSLH